MFEHPDTVQGPWVKWERPETPYKYSVDYVSEIRAILAGFA